MLYCKHTVGLFGHSLVPMQKCGYAINSAPYLEIFHAFLSSAIFFQNQFVFFRKIISIIASECLTDWIQIRPYVLLRQICLQRL